jgi:hypothetical protein
MACALNFVLTGHHSLTSSQATEPAGSIPLSSLLRVYRTTTPDFNDRDTFGFKCVLHREAAHVKEGNCV